MYSSKCTLPSPMLITPKVWTIFRYTQIVIGYQRHVSHTIHCNTRSQGNETDDSATEELGIASFAAAILRKQGRALAV